VAIYGPAADYAPPTCVPWQLIVGDETALPAIGAIVESLGPADRATLIVEVPEAADTQIFDTAADIDVNWLTRHGESAHRSRQLLEAVQSTPIPDGPSYFWLAGESSVVTSIRRHLVRDCGVPREAVVFTGYWKHGVNEDDR
jgi:NADPH-dependent ferric siderophore reductase